MTQETAAEHKKNQPKSTIENEKVEELKRKPVHGRFYRDFEGPSVDKEKSLVCLCSWGITGETESLMIIAEGQALKTIIIRGTS